MSRRAGRNGQLEPDARRVIADDAPTVGELLDDYESPAAYLIRVGAARGKAAAGIENLDAQTAV
jgi:hypothetical protein